MKKMHHILPFAAAMFATCITAFSQPQVLQPPPQTIGLPYTQSAQKVALAKIETCVAIFKGSRYGYIMGKKVRLDDTHWHDEAKRINGVLYIPQAFADALSSKIVTDTPPPYLANKWVYTVQNRRLFDAAGCRKSAYKGRTLLSFEDVVKKMGWQLYQDASGLAIAGSKAPTAFIGREDSNLRLSIITLFDTPEKFADPDIALQFIPSLTRQGKWTQHVKVTPEQLAIIEGDETTEWPTTPTSAYQYEGFNTALLGAKVPPPGQYPRILFSEADVPTLYQRIRKTKMGQMSLTEIEYLLNNTFLNPATDDGKVFDLLAANKTQDLEFDKQTFTYGNGPKPIKGGIPNLLHSFKGYKAGIYNSHVSYYPECFTSMALYALLTQNDALGKKTANALVNYYAMREPVLDEVLHISDSEFGSRYVRNTTDTFEINGNGATNSWRTAVSLMAHMNLPFALDFAGKWMTNDQKAVMQRIIAKTTYGMRAYGQDGPKRFRDINWMTWDLTNFLALTAIEGTPGFDKEAYQTGKESVEAFCEWGIDSCGVVYESNGKTPGGFQFQFLSMIALARRGDNYLAHPHFRKLLTGQVQMTSPTGKVVVNSGTQYSPYSRQMLSYQFASELKAFFPNEKKADYILSQSKQYADANDEYHRHWQFDAFVPDQYKQKLLTYKRLRMPSVMYPGFVHSFLYDADFEQVSRADLQLPTIFSDPVHGVFSAYSHQHTDAVWMNMLVRPDHYLGAGHHHADAGMFHFSGLGVDWFTQSPFHQEFNSKYHNAVLVDGIGEPYPIPGVCLAYQAAATYLGCTKGSNGSAIASANLTQSYTYRWQTQPQQVWTPEADKMGWELEPSARNLQLFAGTARYKMRPWWASHNYSNYIPTCRALFNPMQYVFRSTALINGQQPYGLVLDDLHKDSATHLYQWTANLNGGVWEADIPNLSANQLVLGYRADNESNTPTAKLRPKKGDPLLLVCALGLEQSNDATLPLLLVSKEQGPDTKKNEVQWYHRISINHRNTSVHYKVLLLPFRFGDALPTIAYQQQTATIAWPNGTKETIHFTEQASGRTLITVKQNGNTILNNP